MAANDNNRQVTDEDVESSLHDIAKCWGCSWSQRIGDMTIGQLQSFLQDYCPRCGKTDELDLLKPDQVPV